MRSRAGRRVRKSAIESRRAYMRANARVLVTINAAFMLFVVALVWLTARFANRDVAFAIGGVGSASIAFMIWISAENTQARRQFDGAEAERLTAGTLRWLRWRQWKSVHNIAFYRRDIDHVVAGFGRVFAIETKWTNEAWPIINGAFANRWAQDAVVQCQRNAELIAWLLAGNNGISCRAEPLLVIWGPGRPKLESPAFVDGVLVVSGQLLRRALMDREGAGDVEGADGVIQALRDYIRLRDQHGDTCGEWAHACACADVFRDIEMVSDSVSESLPLVRPTTDRRAA